MTDEQWAQLTPTERKQWRKWGFNPMHTKLVSKEKPPTSRVQTSFGTSS